MRNLISLGCMFRFCMRSLIHKRGWVAAVISWGCSIHFKTSERLTQRTVESTAGSLIVNVLTLAGLLTWHVGQLRKWEGSRPTFGVYQEVKNQASNVHTANNHQHATTPGEQNGSAPRETYVNPQGTASEAAAAKTNAPPEVLRCYILVDEASMYSKLLTWKHSQESFESHAWRLCVAGFLMHLLTTMTDNLLRNCATVSPATASQTPKKKRDC